MLFERVFSAPEKEPFVKFDKEPTSEAFSSLGIQAAFVSFINDFISSCAALLRSFIVINCSSAR